MARFKDPQIPAAAFAPYLEPGEQLQHWAYGVKQPSMAIILPLLIREGEPRFALCHYWKTDCSRNKGGDADCPFPG